MTANRLRRKFIYKHQFSAAKNVGTVVVDVESKKNIVEPDLDMESRGGPRAIDIS